MDGDPSVAAHPIFPVAAAYFRIRNMALMRRSTVPWDSADHILQERLRAIVQDFLAHRVAGDTPNADLGMRHYPRHRQHHAQMAALVHCLRLEAAAACRSELASRRHLQTAVQAMRAYCDDALRLVARDPAVCTPTSPESPPASTSPPPSRPTSRAVSSAALRAWLLAHADAPYPTEEEKAVLAEASGITVRQVNMWFINARRRILHKAWRSPAQ